MKRFSIKAPESKPFESLVSSKSLCVTVIHMDSNGLHYWCFLFDWSKRREKKHYHCARFSSYDIKWTLNSSSGEEANGSITGGNLSVSELRYSSHQHIPRIEFRLWCSNISLILNHCHSRRVVLTMGNFRILI